MGLFSFGRSKETFLAVVTSEGPGRLRLNGLRAKGQDSRKAAAAHERTVCWIEFATDGVRIDQGVGRASAGQAEKILRDLPGNATCKGVLDRLREGQDSVAKWLQLGEPGMQQANRTS